MCYKDEMKPAAAALLSFFLFLTPDAGAGEFTDEAQRIYHDRSGSVCQIRVVDLATGRKSALGSGFLVSREGHVATNYHVVEQAVHAPGGFRVEALRDGEVVGELRIVGIDVVHDLAVAAGPGVKGDALRLGSSGLSKGTRLYSIGNPYDLGMTIVEGTYNGLMERSLYRKILFSGSLNPGMSGGPALNREGEVVGVNVSTAGNEVSFLVPVEYLVELAGRIEERREGGPESWDLDVEEQLLASQAGYMADILSAPWESLTVGEATVPGEIHEVIKCWSESHDLEHDLYRHADVTCSSEESIDVSGTLVTGWLSYSYRWIVSDALNLLRFYSLYESFFESSSGYDNAGEEDVTAFTCEEGFVSVAGRPWKAVLCARSYTRYRSLFDFHMTMASVEKRKRGLVVEAQLLGVSRENALAFARRTMEEIRWREQ